TRRHVKAKRGWLVALSEVNGFGRPNILYGILGQREIVRRPGTISRSSPALNCTASMNRREKNARIFTTLFNWILLREEGSERTSFFLGRPQVIKGLVPIIMT